MISYLTSGTKLQTHAWTILKWNPIPRPYVHSLHYHFGEIIEYDTSYLTVLCALFTCLCEASSSNRKNTGVINMDGYYRYGVMILEPDDVSGMDPAWALYCGDSKQYFVCEKPHGQNESYPGDQKIIYLAIL